MEHLAWIVVGPGTEAERIATVDGRLLIGRECHGAEPNRALILSDPAVSREHLEVRVPLQGSPTLVDLSTNGTWLNGRRVERGEPIPLSDGDAIELGGERLLFRLDGTAEPITEGGMTMVTAPTARLAIVVGDIVGYTETTERDGAIAVALATESLFGAVRELLVSHGGTVSNYLGDAILAAWDLDRDPGSLGHAMSFVVAAHVLATETAAGIDVRDANGEPLRMGWGVSQGEAVVSRPSGGQAAVLGDAVNLAFRLSSLAGRDGLPAILATADAAELAPGAAEYGEPFELKVKGRAAEARVRSVSPPELPPPGTEL